MIGAARCPRIVHVDYVVGIGSELLQAVRQIGPRLVVAADEAAQVDYVIEWVLEHREGGIDLKRQAVPGQPP